MSTKTSRLVTILLPEACQTEQSAKTQCAREAKRLGTAPPAGPMREASAHARTTLGRLQKLAAERGVKASRGPARAVGRLFSMMRALTSDLFGSEEKSYRGTLLGMQHGRGVFLLLEDAAVESGDQELADLCAAWLAERTPMLGHAEQELSWFAEHLDVALARAAFVTPARPRALA